MFAEGWYVGWLAAPNGRPLYESLGFTQTNEMRYQSDISAWNRQNPAR